jgi:uncharacterized membrane protein YphA (DoxX/SURF4 family)
MNAVFGLGKYLFAVPFAVFGVMHLMNADGMAGWAPFGGSIIIYITGICLIAAAVAIIIGKYDKLATALLGLMLLIFALWVHAKGLANAADEMSGAASMSNLLKDLMLCGASWLYAGNLAKDNSIVG